MILRGSFGSIVEQVLGSGLGAIIGILLAEAGWRAARRSLPSALRRTADRLSESPAQPGERSAPAVPSVFGPLEFAADGQPTRRAIPPLGRPALVAAPGTSPELEVSSAGRETLIVAVPPFGALVIGSGPKAHIRLPGIAESAAMFQQNGGKLTLLLLDPAPHPVASLTDIGEREFGVGQSLEIGGALIRRTT